MKIKFSDLNAGIVTVEQIRNGDTFFASNAKLKPIDNLIAIHQGFVQFLKMDGVDYVAITKIPPGCNNPTYLLMLRSDIVAMADYINADANTAEDTDEKI